MLFKSAKLSSILQFQRAKSAPHLWVKECYLEMVYQHLLKRKQHGLVCMPDRLNAVRERNGLGLSQSMQNLGSTNAVLSLSQTQLEEVKSNNENTPLKAISEVVSLCLLIGKYRICVWSHFYIPICSWPWNYYTPNIHFDICNQHVRFHWSMSLWNYSQSAPG